MNANRFRRPMSLVAALCVLLGASAAFALDKDDILRLHEAGLDAGTIVNVIRGTTEELEVTAEDVDELEAAGLPAQVIAELRLRTGTQTPTDLQQELQEQQRLEQERLRLEQERRAREAEQLREQQRAREQGAEGGAEGGFRGLRQAQALLRDGEYLQAAAVYNRFLEEMQPMAGSEEYYEAKFGLVSALFEAGARSAIRADLLEVALMGADWGHFTEAVSMLHTVVADTGFASPRIADLSNEVVASFPQGFQDEFNYFLGRYYYDKGDYEQALNHLSAVSGGGDYAARAAFLSGVALINPALGENIRGVQSFQQAITRARPRSDVDEDVLENAYLALARIAYQVGNFGGALYYYNKIGTESERATTALFEGAWTYFLSGDLNRAVGSFHSLHSPYHAHRFYPDLYVLEAAAYLYSCNIDEAHEAVATFEEVITPLRDRVTEILAEVSDPQVFYDAVFDPVGNRERGGATLPEQALETILADADFYALYDIIGQLEDELALLRPAVESLGARGAETLASLEVELRNKQVEAGLLIRDIIYNLSLELEDWWFKAQEVEIEITDLEARYLEAILSGGEAAITEGTTFFVVPDDWQYWPWEGEYWFDEVGNYRGHLTTRCPDDVVF